MDEKSLGEWVTVVGSESSQTGDMAGTQAGRHSGCLDDRDEGRGHTDRHLK